VWTEGKIGTIRVGLNEIAAPQSYLSGFFHSARCESAGLVPRQVHEANSEYVIVNLVAAGVGLAFLNRSFGSMPSRDVILRDVDDLSVPVKLELAWRRDTRLPALARFVETVAASDQVTRRQLQRSGSGF
jgi:DNA-binding transcriptional LysR family regulator